MKYEHEGREADRYIFAGDIHSCVLNLVHNGNNAVRKAAQRGKRQKEKVHKEAEIQRTSRNSLHSLLPQKKNTTPPLFLFSL